MKINKLINGGISQGAISHFHRCASFKEGWEKCQYGLDMLTIAYSLLRDKRGIFKVLYALCADFRNIVGEKANKALDALSRYLNKEAEAEEVEAFYPLVKEEGKKLLDEAKTYAEKFKKMGEDVHKKFDVVRDTCINASDLPYLESYEYEESLKELIDAINSYENGILALDDVLNIPFLWKEQELKPLIEDSVKELTAEFQGIIKEMEKYKGYDILDEYDQMVDAYYDLHHKMKEVLLILYGKENAISDKVNSLSSNAWSISAELLHAYNAMYYIVKLDGECLGQPLYSISISIAEDSKEFDKKVADLCREYLTEELKKNSLFDE